MKHIKILIIIGNLLLCNSNIIAQLPINLIPNPSFTETTGATSMLPGCNTQLFNTQQTWIKVLHWEGNNSNNTPEWRSFASDNSGWNSICVVCSPFNTNNPNFDNPFLDDKYIYIGKDDETPNGEYLLTELYNTLDNGKKYKLRVIGQGSLKALPSMHIPSVIEIHLTLRANNWHHQSELGKNMMSMMYCTYQEYECKPRSFEHVFTVSKNNLKQIVLQANNAGFYIDRVELYEYCTDLLTRQGRIYKFDRELEEAGTIIAGSVINNAPAMGDVEMLDGSVTMYKASTQVKLTEGFYVNRGADFTAKIAPCGKDCPTTDVNIPTEYVLCNSDCIDLTTGTVSRGLTVNWTAQDQQNLTYLSSVNVLNPVFCPPSGTSGVYEYDVVIQNGCGETTTKRVTIKYFGSSVPSPSIQVVSSNLATLPTYPSISVSSTEYTEYITFDVMDCNGNLLHTQTFNFFNQQMPPAPAQFSFTDFLDPCGCYKIRIRHKNYCNATIAEQIIDWNRQQSLSNLFFPNVTICKNGKRYICFDGKGIKQFQLQLFNIWGQSILNTTDYYTKNPFCIEFPSNLPAGTYYYIMTFIGCDGSTTTVNGAIQVNDCNENQLLMQPIELDSIEAANPANDSILLVLSPNPATNNVSISFTIPYSGQVKLKLLDKNLNELYIAHDEVYTTSGTYEVTTQIAQLPVGTNYCLLEFITTDTKRIYKRLSVIR
jgi:hypothetical protein